MTPLTEAKALYWARCYHTDADDALQELWLWQHEGGTSMLELRTRIARQGVGVITYGANVHRGVKPIDAELPAHIAEDEDLTAVHRAFRYWRKSRILSDAAAEAIYRHYVDGQQVKDIAALYGVSWRSVEGHVWRGIERIREAVSASG